LALSVEVAHIARERVALELAKRVELVNNQVGDTYGLMNKRGVLISGMTYQDVRNLVAQEYEIRAALTWQAWRTALAAARAPVTDVRPVLVDEVKSALAAGSQDLEGHYMNAVRLTNTLSVNHQQTLAAMRVSALKRAESDIDYAILEATSERTEKGAGPTFHIHGNVGAVMTGAGASATVHQTFGQTERESISRALEAVKQATAGLPESERVQVVEVVEAVAVEAKKDKPNLLTIRSLSAGIATAIQTLGAARPAYDMLKGALALLGITLP